MTAQRAFGLDIGGSLIKVVKLVKTGNVVSLGTVAYKPSPQQGILSESPIDQENLAKIIKDLVNQANITDQLVNIALPENQVFTRVIDMPSLSDRELASAIRWEAEQYIPFPLDETSLDYQVLERSKNTQGKMQVLIIAASMSLINKYKRVITLAGLTPLVLETEIFASVRALIKSPQESSAIIIDTGTTTTDIAVVRKGVPVFNYSFGTGGNAITRAIASDFGIDLAQAEIYKQTYGLKDVALKGKLTEVITPLLSSIITEVKKGISFYQEHYPQEEGIRRVILSGGMARMPEITVFFANSLGIEVEVANPWHGLSLDQALFSQVLPYAPLFTIATGLALRSL